MSETDVREALAAAGPEERERILRGVIRTQVASLLSLTSIEDDSNFLEHGLNSMSALELTKNLMELTGLEIPLITIVDHPTPAELSSYVAEEYTGEKDSTTERSAN